MSDDTQPKDLMTLEETIEGLESLARFLGQTDHSDRDLCLAALHHLEAGRKDVEQWWERCQEQMARVRELEQEITAFAADTPPRRRTNNLMRN